MTEPTRRTLRARRLLGVAAGVMAGVILAACSPAAQQAPDAPGDHAGARRGGTAILGLGSDMDSLNPYLSAQAQTRDVAYQVFESLLEEQGDFGQGPPTFLPGLASSWEFSPEGTQLTFHLRPEARWTDGTPITAEDVVFSHAAAIHPDVAWIAADVKKMITTVAAADAHTVVYSFSRVYPYQLMDANDGVILPRHIWSTVPFSAWRSAGLDRQPVSSGPFRVQSWTPNQSIELRRNETYFDAARPLLDGVVFRIAPDPGAGLQQLLGGSLESWDRIEPRDLARLEAAPQIQVWRYPDRYFGFIAWNLRRPMFADASVRLALTMAIDRRRIIDDLFLGTAQLATSPLPPLFWAHNAAIPPHPHAPDEAARLLDVAGWTDADGDGRRERLGVPMAFDLDFNSDSALRQDIALLVQEDLGRLGIQVRLAPLERNVVGARRRAGDFDAFIGGWRLPTKVDLGVIFHSRAMESGVNLIGYASAEIDDLLDRAADAPRAQEAKPLLDEAQAILHRDQPYTFLYWQDRLVAYSTRLHGVQPNAHTPFFNLDEWWVEPAAGPH